MRGIMKTTIKVMCFGFLSMVVHLLFLVNGCWQIWQLCGKRFVLFLFRRNLIHFHIFERIWIIASNFRLSTRHCRLVMVQLPNEERRPIRIKVSVNKQLVRREQQHHDYLTLKHDMWLYTTRPFRALEANRPAFVMLIARIKQLGR